MTREEAIERLTDFEELCECVSEDKEAVQMAIKALEQEPCEDCISREAVLMELGKYLCGVPYEKGIDVVIKELPPVTPQPKTGQWIPVSERLPERDGWYLISLGDKTYGGVDVDMYCKGWVKYGTHVLAWMSLPEPYEPTN